MKVSQLKGDARTNIKARYIHRDGVGDATDAIAITAWRTSMRLAIAGTYLSSGRPWLGIMVGALDLVFVVNRVPRWLRRGLMGLFLVKFCLMVRDLDLSK